MYRYMIDIETTGVDKKNDSILEVALVEIQKNLEGFWESTNRVFNKVLHYPGKPKDSFALEHMSDLYKLCNEINPKENYSSLRFDLLKFINYREPKVKKPHLFMGLNASGFDLPFLFEKGVLEPSYCVDVNGKQEICGDVHYRVYEQTGAIELLVDATGFDRRMVVMLANELYPFDRKQHKGKQHNALFDCHKQIALQNGLIKLSRTGWSKYE